MAQVPDSEIADLTAQLRCFRDERDWGQFHQPKDLAIALSVEASELLEVYLWKTSEDAKVDRVREELADVFAYALLLADRLGLDVREIVQTKLRLNAAKYPVEQSRGSNRKYTELGS
jgi:NTP pyrophosphatase (non-canonical NTP hydrolase)